MEGNDDILSFLSKGHKEQASSGNDLDFWLSANLNGENNETNRNKTKSNTNTSIDINIDVEVEKKKKNTLASARFRAKKKQKDLELKMENEELHKQVLLLQGKLKDKELEIKWLKDLIIEKSKNSHQQELHSQLALLLPSQFQK